MIKFMLTIIHRDLLLIVRQPSEILNPLVFFLLVIALFPLGISPEATLLSKTAAGMIWVAAMLATLLSLELLFKLDHDDGSLEQLLLAPYPSWSLVLAKVFVHWLVPVSAILLGWLFLEESLQTPHIIGMAMIALGLSAIDGRLWRRASET